MNGFGLVDRLGYGAGGAGASGDHDTGQYRDGCGFDALKGAKISNTQLLDLAPAFAQALGVTVADD